MLNKIFDSNGIAQFNCEVLVYGYSPINNEYVGKNWVRIFKFTGIPSNSTVIKPPEEKGENKCFVFNGTDWSIVDDFRGLLIRNKETQLVSLMNTLGPLPDNYEFYK